jgi:hypothetical protein
MPTIEFSGTQNRDVTRPTKIGVKRRCAYEVNFVETPTDWTTATTEPSRSVRGK